MAGNLHNWAQFVTFLCTSSWAKLHHWLINKLIHILLHSPPSPSLSFYKCTVFHAKEKSKLLQFHPSRSKVQRGTEILISTGTCSLAPHQAFLTEEKPGEPALTFCECSVSCAFVPIWVILDKGRANGTQACKRRIQIIRLWGSAETSNLNTESSTNKNPTDGQVHII